MKIDPRNTPLDEMIPYDNKGDCMKTLVLLRLLINDGINKPPYFIVEGLKHLPCTHEEMQEQDNYFYEEGTCPTNFIDIPMIFWEGDCDPHGLFDHVETIWQTKEYLEREKEGDKEGYLLEAFPQLIKESA